MNTMIERLLAAIHRLGAWVKGESEAVAHFAEKEIKMADNELKSLTDGIGAALSRAAANKAASAATVKDLQDKLAAATAQVQTLQTQLAGVADSAAQVQTLQASLTDTQAQLADAKDQLTSLLAAAEALAADPPVV